MASIKRYKKGWRAEINRRGVRKAKTFDTRQQAVDWAAKAEAELVGGESYAAKVAFRDVMARYAREVSPSKKGARWESLRLEAFGRDNLGDVRLSELAADDLAAWRDRRLRVVAPGTVRREMVLLSSVLNVARKEWLLIGKNPLTDVKKPTEPPPRDRLPQPDEFERMAFVAGDDLRLATARAYHAFRFSCATAMRAGEIIGLTWDRVDLADRVAHLPMTKNGSARKVPMTTEAVELLRELPKLDPVFGLTSRQLDALWRKVRGRAGVEGLTFHDGRAFALTTLARKVDVLTLARISGHRDLKVLSQVYYRETASEIAKRLD